MAADAESGAVGAEEVPAGVSNVLFELWLTSRATTSLIDRAVRASGLDADEFAVYSVLASADGMTPTELARWMSAPATTVSSYVKRFERRGHIRRVENPDDRRSYRLALSKAGADAHRVAGELFAPVLAEVDSHLGGEAAALRPKLDAVRRAVDEADRSGPGASPT